MPTVYTQSFIRSRQSGVLMAERLYRQYRRILIVPMTLANRRYLDIIRQGLAAIAPPLYHFCLVASLDTIEQGWRNRDQNTSWPRGKARHYVPLFNDPAYAVHVNTEHRPVVVMSDARKRCPKDSQGGRRL